MLNALLSLGHNQFEWARWAPESYDNYKLIQVERVSDNEKRWNPMLQNISTTSDSTLLRTAYMYDFKPYQHVFFDGKWQVILSVRKVSTDVNPQALALVRGGSSQYILEIGEADGYDVDGVYTPVQGV